MFPTEQLNILWLECSQNQKLIADLRDSIRRISNSSSFQDWMQSSANEPFTVPEDEIETSQILKDYGLIEGNKLLIKINRIGEKIFLTDGAWVSHLLRVFPDPDEALFLLNYVEANDLHKWADWVVDPGSGCGHTPIGFPGSARRVACDANARAILFSRINALLNELESDQYVPLLNDMNDGLPPQIQMDGNVLFLANVPFAPSPRKGALALNSAGGTTGADLQVASLKMVERFRKETNLPVRACFVTWTVGSPEKTSWEVPSLARELFPHQKIKWEIIQHDYDAPEIPNPAPVADMFAHLAKSQYAVDSADPKVEQEYKELAEKLVQQGHTHIAYGMLDIDLT